ncbi:hypothetical protein L9F63_012651, partial [Diploptera punctata]
MDANIWVKNKVVTRQSKYKMTCFEQTAFSIVCILASLTCFETKQNILLIVVDDLRPSLGCYGDEMARTPFIDELANRSVIFKNAFVQQALCAPSRNSFLTSRRPDTLHLYDFYSYWRTSAGNFTTLPQYFKQNGYHTKSIGKVFHPGKCHKCSDEIRPYSWSEEPYHPPTEQYKEAKVCPQPDGSLKRAVVCPVIVELQPGHSLPDLQSLQEANKFLDSWPKSSAKSFFLAIGFHKPHLPLKYPVKYLDQHPLESISLPAAHERPSALPTVSWNPWIDLREREDVSALNVSFPFGPMPDEYGVKIIQSYYAAVTYVDDLVGQLLKKLETNGFSNNTIILLVGDHGWSMAEHGEWSKFSNFEIAVRVPLIMHVPGLTDTGGAHYTNALVELVDIFPTLVELEGMPDLPLCPDVSSNITLCTEGVSTVPLLFNISRKEGQLQDGRVFSQYPRPGTFPTLHPDSDRPRLKQIKIMGYSLRTAVFRYTEWVLFDRTTLKPDWTHVIAKELYHHGLDPGENMNLADRSVMADIMQNLSQQLHA